MEDFGKIVDDERIERKMFEKQSPWDVGVGDILVYDAGYSWIMPVFVVVTRRTEKMFWTQRLHQIVVSDDGYGQSGTVMPDIESVHYSYPEVGNRIIDSYLRVEGHYAKYWNGDPVFFDYYD